MNDIIYLKDDRLILSVTAYNPNNLTSVNVYGNEYCELDTFDQDSFEFSIDYALKRNGFTIATRQEFNDAFIGFSKTLNEITAEL